MVVAGNVAAMSAFLRRTRRLRPKERPFVAPMARHQSGHSRPSHSGTLKHPVLPTYGMPRVS